MVPPGSMEDEEHDDGDNEDDGKVTVLLLLVHSVSLGHRQACKKVKHNYGISPNLFFKPSTMDL